MASLSPAAADLDPFKVLVAPAIDAAARRGMGRTGVNLFVVGWNLTEERRRQAVRALLDVAENYALLDVRTHSTLNHGPLFASCLAHSPDTAAPAVYARRFGSTLVLFDGCPVDPTGSFRAHDARELGGNWDRLDHVLEGQFAAFRLDTDERSLQLVNDPLGIHQTYLHEHGDSCLFSNSVEVISRVAQAPDLDLTGAAMFLTMGWVGGDRTLRRGIRTLPAAQRWRFEGKGTDKRTYYDLSEVTRQPKRHRFDDGVELLARRFGDMFRVLDDHFAPLECPITAGRDSRMMVGTLLANGLEASYFTRGDTESVDVRIGREIAGAFSLPHEVRGADPGEVIGKWDMASRRLVVQTDGMVTLAHVRNAATEPATLERLIVQLYGAGGTIARGLYTDELSLLQPATVGRVRRRLHRTVLPSNTLLRPWVLQVAKEFVDNSIEELLGVGVAVRDIPDAFAVSQLERRWAGTQFRQIASRKTSFSPFCTRPYAEAAFTVPPALRFAELIPRRLLEHLSPDLHALPYGKPWRPPTRLGLTTGYLPAWAIGKAARRAGKAGRGSTRALPPGRGRERAMLLELKRKEILGMCLDQESSLLWDLLDRRRFEAIMLADDNAKDRRRHHEDLFNVATAFLYADLIAERRPSRASSAGASVDAFETAPAQPLTGDRS